MEYIFYGSVVSGLCILGYYMYKKRVKNCGEDMTDSKLVLFRDDHDQAIIEIFETGTDLIPGNQGELMKLTPEMEHNLLPMLQQVPNLLGNATRLVERQLVVSIKPEFLKGIEDGTFSMMKAKGGGIRLNVVNVKNGRIVSQGKIKEIVKVNSKQLATGIFNVASLVVGQIHLAEIDEKLGLIAKTAEGIKHFLNDSRYGNVLKGLQYMKNYREAIASGTLTMDEKSRFLDHLDDIEMECSGIMISIEKGWARPGSDITNLEIPSYKLTESHNKVINGIVNFENEFGDPYLWCIFARTIVGQFGSALGTNRQVLLARCEDLEQSIEKLAKTQDAFRETVTAWNEKLRKKVPIFDRINTKHIEQCSNEILATMNQGHERLSSRLKEIRIGVQSNKGCHDPMTGILSQGMKVNVCIDQDGRIKSMAKVLAS